MAFLMPFNVAKSQSTSDTFDLVGGWLVNGIGKQSLLDCRENGYCASYSKKDVTTPWKLSNVIKFSKSNN